MLYNYISKSICNKNKKGKIRWILQKSKKAAFQSYCDINDYDSSSLLRALMHEFLLNEQDTIKIHSNKHNRNSNNVTTTNNYYTSNCDDDDDK